MTRAVWKYVLPPPGRNHVSYVRMPRGARILSVGVQKNVPTVWALVDPEETALARQCFFVYATGEEMAESPDRFLATFQIAEDERSLVFHVFYAGELLE